MSEAPPHLAVDDPDVIAITDAIRAGDHVALASLIERRPELVVARYGSRTGTSTTILHVATDFPGHFPRVGETIRLLAAAGAEVNARFVGPHTETPLHWAASSNDVDALTTLLELGADLEADGGVLTGGPPLDDAIVFDQIEAARALVEAGATTQLFHAAALGLIDRVELALRGPTPPSPEELTAALWHACRRAETAAARLLLAAGADPTWVGWNDESALSLARASGDHDLVELLEAAPT